MPHLPPETAPPGDYSFTPSDDRLLSFLRRKIAGEPLPAAAAAHVHDADIYTAGPALLTVLFEPAPTKKGERGSWFFFTHVRPKSSSDTRRSRQVAGGAGTWHSERAPRCVLDDEGSCVGHRQYFSYEIKIGKNCNRRTEWYMVEFSDGQEHDHERVHGAEPQLVLCKIYKAHANSRSGSGSASRPSCSVSARKRKAVNEASAQAKAKRRLFDSPAPPTSAARSQELVRSSGWISGEAVTTKGKVGDTSERNALMSKADCEAATLRSQGKIGDSTDWIALMSKADGEASTSQLKIGDTSDFSRFRPEPDATFDSGCSMTGGTLPTLKNCSRANVRGVDDVFCRRDARPSALPTSDGTTAFVRGVPSSLVLPPPGQASWWSGSHNILEPLLMWLVVPSVRLTKILGKFFRVPF